MDHHSSSDPDHPSNELHDAAYPVSDYQPGNLSQPSSSSAPQGNASKYTEIAAPSLALTSGQASSSWHGAGPSHLDNSLDPPPSYEQSQSHSQSRPTTSSQPSTSQASQPSASNLSIIPPNNPGPSPHSPDNSSPNATPLRPIPTYLPPRPSGPPSNNFQAAMNSAPVYGPMPAISYQKPEPRTRLERLRRKSCYTTLLLVGVFLLALFVGLMIGFRDKLDDDDPGQESRKPGNNQLFREAGNYPPSQTVTQTVFHTVIE